MHNESGLLRPAAASSGRRARFCPPRVLLVLLVLGACAPATRTAPAASSAPVADLRVADRLFLGREVPGGGSVSEAEWSAFVRDVVTPRFPEGLTLWRAEGQWREPGGRLVTEPVMVLEVFHGGGAAAEESIAAIAREYKRRFRQDAVLRVSTSARLHFFE